MEMTLRKTILILAIFVAALVFLSYSSFFRESSVASAPEIFREVHVDTWFDLGIETPVAPAPEIFREVHEMVIDVGPDGSASCRYLARLEPSEIADFMKTHVRLVGVDRVEQTYIESLRESFAEYGLEVRGPVCQVTFENTFEFTIEWETPLLFRWNGENWVATFEWIDAQEAAARAIAEVKDEWVTVRNVARIYNVQNLIYEIRYKTTILLPEGADNVYCSLLGSSWEEDYGGGSYERGILTLEENDGRSAIVEEGREVIITENEITITPEQLLENFPSYSVTYAHAPPAASFAESLEQVRLDLKYGRELKEQYPVCIRGSWYYLSPAQLLYHMADTIVAYDQGGELLVQQPVRVLPPGDESGEWEACWKELSKEEYVDLALEIRGLMGETGRAPGEIETPVGKMRFRDALYLFSRVLSAYSSAGKLPDSVIFAPVPTGELRRGGSEIPAEIAYFLLPDSYVITGTERVGEILENLQDNYTDYELAKALCEWTRYHISYGLSFRPPTSEEILENGIGQCRDYANVYLALTRSAGIPARRVSGWVVSAWQPPHGWEFAVGETPDGRPIGGHGWVEVYLGGKWLPADPTAGLFENLSYDIYHKVEQSWRDALADYETARDVI